MDLETASYGKPFTLYLSDVPTNHDLQLTSHTFYRCGWIQTQTILVPNQPSCPIQQLGN